MPKIGVFVLSKQMTIRLQLVCGLDSGRTHWQTFSIWTYLNDNSCLAHYTKGQGTKFIGNLNMEMFKEMAYDSIIW